MVSPYRFAAVGGNVADPTIAALSPTAWYDPSVLSSVFQDAAGSTPGAVDSPVGRVNDLSGNGNHIVLTGVAGNRPTLRSGGGLYWLEFDNTGKYLDCTGLTLTQPNDFAAGAWWDNLGAARHIFDGITTRQALIGNTTNIAEYAGTAIRNCAGISTLTPYVFKANFNGASSFIRTNGSSTTVTLTPGSNGLSGLRVGTFSGTGGAMYGRVYFLLCRDAVFDATETTTIETYGKSRSGASF